MSDAVSDQDPAQPRPGQARNVSGADRVRLADEVLRRHGFDPDAPFPSDRPELLTGEALAQYRRALAELDAELDAQP